MLYDQNPIEFPSGNRSDFTQNLEKVCAGNKDFLALTVVIVKFGTHQKKSRSLERSLFLAFYEFKVSYLDDEYQYNELAKQLGFTTGSTHVYRSGRLFRLFCTLLEKSDPKITVPDPRWCTAFGAFTDFAEEHSAETIDLAWVDRVLGGSKKSIRGWYDRRPKDSNHGRPRNNPEIPLVNTPDDISDRNTLGHKRGEFAPNLADPNIALSAVIEDQQNLQSIVSNDLPSVRPSQFVPDDIQFLSIDKATVDGEIICTIRLSNNPALSLRDILTAALKSDLSEFNPNSKLGGLKK